MHFLQAFCCFLCNAGGNFKNSQNSRPHSQLQTKKQGCLDLSDHLELKYPAMTPNAGVTAQTPRDGCLHKRWPGSRVLGSLEMLVPPPRQCAPYVSWMQRHLQVPESQGMGCGGGNTCSGEVQLQQQVKEDSGLLEVI